MAVHRFFLVSAAIVALLPAACASSSSRHAGTQDGVAAIAPAAGVEAPVEAQPVAVNIGAIDVETSYVPLSDQKDISSSFPTPPDMALKNHIMTHYQATGVSDTLKFVIEDARAYHQMVENDNTVARWLQMGRSDEYTVFIKLRMYQETVDGTQGEHSILTFKKLFSMSESLSIADREREQMRNIGLMIQDIDQAIMQVMREKMRIADGSAAPDPNRNAFVYSLLSAPEVR